jgi:alanine racemase
MQDDQPDTPQASYNVLFSAHDRSSRGDRRFALSSLEEQIMRPTFLEDKVRLEAGHTMPVIAKPSSRPVRARVNPAAITHNLAQLRRHLAAQSAGELPRIWATVKANAYGHGIARVLPALREADGLAVLLLSEALACRHAGWQGPLLVYAGLLNRAEMAYLDLPDLHLVITDLAQLDWLAESQPECPPDLWLRYTDDLDPSPGFNAVDYAAAYARAQELAQKGRVRTVSHLSHIMATRSANDISQAEQSFLQVVQPLPGPISMGHAAAYLRQGAQVPRCDWIRHGLCLYGASVLPDVDARRLGLKPAMSVHSRLISIWEVAAGDSVCYGHAFVAPQAMRIGIVACGYGDGYPRHTVTGTPVLIEGVRTRMLGRVSMNAMVVDLTPLPHVRVGAPVTLWGTAEISAEEVARSAGSIAAQLFTGLTARVPFEIVREQST